MKQFRPHWLWPGFAVYCLLAACASQPTGHQQAESDIHQALKQAAAADKPVKPAAPPAAVNEALIPPVGSRLPGAGAPADERFDLSVKDADARTFFMDLVKGTHYNMVVHPEVTGHISLTLKNVTVPQVMETVRQVYGYDYERTSTGYVVFPATIQTRIFQVNYLDFTRKGTSRTRVTSGQSTENTGNNAFGGYNPYGGGVPAGGGLNRQQEKQSGSEIETKSKSDFWEKLQSTLTAIVGNKDGRKVIVNAEAGVVVVRAMPAELREVKHYLDTVQGNADREVILETKILEVQLKHGFQSGINWAALGRPGAGKTILGGQVGGTNLFPNNPANTNSQIQSDLNGLPLTIGPGQQITSLPSSAFGGTFALALNLNDFNAFIELLDTQGDVHVLSSPRVATTNNQQAVIKVGSDEFFVTGIFNNTFVGTSTTNNQNIILTPFFSGIALDVTPQIDNEGFVTLHIHPSVTSVTDQRKDLTVGGVAQSLPLAFTEVRESDSVVRARSGQIVVIGGLMKNQTETDVAKTPLLGDIPLLGNLFTQKRQRTVKTELVILMKPIVIENGRSWAKVAQDHLNDFKDLENHPDHQ